MLDGNQNLGVLTENHSQIDGFLRLNFEQCTGFPFPGGVLAERGEQKLVIFPALDADRLNGTVRQTPDCDRFTLLGHRFYYTRVGWRRPVYKGLF